MRKHFTVTALSFLAVILLPLTAAILSKDFVKYTGRVQWNQAREVCAMERMTLAILNNRFSQAFLREAFSVKPQYNTDDMWIGLHDAAQMEGQLGSQGFLWANCRLLDSSDINWAVDEPLDRLTNWCVRLLYQQDLTWQPAKCTTVCQFVCEKRRSSCKNFVDAAKEGCNVTSAGLTPMADNSTSDSNCRSACIDQIGNGIRCWMYTYEVTAGCVLFVGKIPVYCDRELAVNTNGSKSTVQWVRDCFSMSYNTSTELGVPSSNVTYALDDCSGPENVTGTTAATPVPFLSSAAATAVQKASPSASPPTSKEPVNTETSAVTNQEIQYTMAAHGFSLTKPSCNFVSGKTSSSNVTGSPRCRCVLNHQPMIVSVKKVTELTQEIQQRLTLNKTELSSTRRQKESVKDDRATAQAAGILGIAMLVAVLCLIVVSDLVTLFRCVLDS